MVLTVFINFVFNCIYMHAYTHTYTLALACIRVFERAQVYVCTVVHVYDYIHIMLCWMGPIKQSGFNWI